MVKQQGKSADSSGNTQGKAKISYSGNKASSIACFFFRYRPQDGTIIRWTKAARTYTQQE